MKIHRLLKTLRESRGLSFGDLAERTGLARASVHRGESDRYRLLRLETLDKLLRSGYGMKRTAPDYREIIEAWTEARTTGRKVPARSLAEKIAALPAEKQRALERMLEEL